MENLYQSNEEYSHIKNALFALAVDIFTKNKKNFDLSETEAYMAYSHEEAFVKNLLKDVITKFKRSQPIAAAVKEDGFENTKAFANKINFRGFSADPFQDLEKNELINGIIKMAWFYVFVPSQFEVQKNMLSKKSTESETNKKKKNDFGAKKDFGKSWDFNDYIGNNNEDDEEEDFDDEEDEENDEAHKFVVITIQKAYICNGEGYWDKDDWDNLEEQNHRICYIYDAKHFNLMFADRIPDYTPKWLYKILDKAEYSTPNGYCSEDVESTFEISNETYNVLIHNPRCTYYEGYDDEDDENIDNNSDDNHSFRILKYSKAQRKRNEELNPGMIYPDRELVYIFDASEQFLPDHTPDWLYDIMNSVDQYGWDELMESIFDVSPEFLDKLSKHPQCIEYRECTNKEAGFDDKTTKPKLPKCKTETMNKVIDLIYDHYGFTRMELYWEISIKQHYLTVRDIYHNPIIYIYKDTPNLIYVDNYLHTAPIDINKAGWEKKLISKLDAIIKREKQIDQEREKNGFNDALRRAGLYDIFH